MSGRVFLISFVFLRFPPYPLGGSIAVPFRAYALFDLSCKRKKAPVRWFYETNKPAPEMLRI